MLKSLTGTLITIRARAWRWLWPVMLVALAFQAGCSSLSSYQSVSESKVLFADGFASEDSGWSTWKEADSSAVYSEGGLRITIHKPHFDYWSRPGKRFANARIEVDARRLSGPENNDFGAICRYRNSGNFYAFLISSDQYYGIVRVQDGQYTVLSGGQMQYSDAILGRDGTNHLRVECSGVTLALTVNNRELARVEDSTFLSGEVGVMAGSYDDPGVDVWFDNFIVLQP